LWISWLPFHPRHEPRETPLIALVFTRGHAQEKLAEESGKSIFSLSFASSTGSKCLSNSK
jgi:hypothetical protein